jgi:hypothetical protein
MKSIRSLLATSIIAAAHAAGAADKATAPAPCAAPVHHQFDFWIGQWRVTENGKAAGTNRIDRLLGGCALLENWVGAGGGRGHSLNFYDPARALWQQTWVDNAGGVLNLTGQLADGRMVLSGTSIDPKTHAPHIDRITWTPKADGTVRQLWDRSDDAGRSWKVLFDGLYTRQAP